MVWMSPQSAKMETRRGRWIDVNRERRGVMKKANSTVVLRRRGTQDRQGSERRWGSVGVGEASGEVKRDEKEVDGEIHAEGNELDELKV